VVLPVPEHTEGCISAAILTDPTRT
jgi:hypothetical protein